ncbi:MULTISPECIES: glycosyltransferase [unclassified Duganella]|uniref:O-linked N-acetylglucosamine transferase family protein n=1 Tax=unclassified Duganella TaxID=2636909 RepID=UPI00088B6455|nr:MULTISPECIES: glycosyltransferase [unclassified Duganella]SDH50773.1 Predicted O-linked N-acetylglucosamine transferase, SPINDLY family [Duganella sp. OV458]SDK62807.1 Predicted O-linked N-acetylglucosamine transferase, SPINDLY family [Duganella sp. OV510]
MSSSQPSDESHLQELNRALAANELTQAAKVAFVLAKRGSLPIMQLIGLAGLMGHAGQAARAAELYHLWLRCTESPLLFAAWYNLGVLQIQADEQQEAEQSLRAALAIKPDFIDARMALGSLQERLRQHEAALSTWRAALAQIDPDHPASRPQQIQALNSVARVAALRQHYPEAEDACARSLLLDPKQPDIAAQWIQLRQQQCAWPVCAPLPGLAETELANSASAASSLCISDDPAEQRAAAGRHPVNRAAAPAPLADEQGYLHRKLRIGYLSSDFGSHAARLTAELYGLHQREQFEIYGFSWNEEDRSGLRARVAPQMDHHIRLTVMSDLQAAQTIRAHEIDILVDLHGLGADGRPGILAHRAAPVQISWLGHPGSSAMPAVDYILADAFVLPPQLAASFSEQPLYLPDCVQLHDRRRAAVPPSAPAPTRTSCGLPEDAFVFCNFNSSRKLAPAQFAGWMRILKRVPGSVLWLAADSEPVRDNLRVAALRHGVASERLLFAARVAPADFLARLQLADLCLDTQPFSGGAAAADALWAGVPLLTQAGDSYAARLGGSLLHAIDLPELVTHSAKAYEDKAARLAGKPEELARLRRRLAKNRDKAPLFDTPKLVRELEQLYLQVARGTLQQDGAASRPDVSLPLVSILIPTGDHDSPEQLEYTVRSALDQHYGRCEIIVSDSGKGDARRRRLARLQAAHASLRYNRAPTLDAGSNLDHCLTLALGEYIAVAPPGEVLHADKISRMMHFYQAYPAIGLVACWRQPVDAHGQPLPGAPLLPAETALSGASLAAVLLANERGAGDVLCQPASLLLRREQLGAAFGHYRGRRYRPLAGVATALAALTGRECAYLPAPLSSYQPAAALPPAGAEAQPEGLQAALERLYLLYEDHTRQNFLTDGATFKALLARRLDALTTLVRDHHATLAAGDPQRSVILQQALSQGYHLLLAPAGA